MIVKWVGLTLKIADIHKVDGNIATLQKVIDGKPLTGADKICLQDTMSILKGIKKSPHYNNARRLEHGL